MKALIILTIIIFSTPFSFADTIKIKDKFLNSIENLLNDNFKGTDFTIKSKENTKPEIGILTLKPIIDNLYKSNLSINNLDINLICEQPKVSKYRNKIINSISKLTTLDKNQINLKGKQ